MVQLNHLVDRHDACVHGLGLHHGGQRSLAAGVHALAELGAEGLALVGVGLDLVAHGCHGDDSLVVPFLADLAHVFL